MEIHDAFRTTVHIHKLALDEKANFDNPTHHGLQVEYTVTRQVPANKDLVAGQAEPAFQAKRNLMIGFDHNGQRVGNMDVPSEGMMSHDRYGNEEMRWNHIGTGHERLFAQEIKDALRSKSTQVETETPLKQEQVKVLDTLAHQMLIQADKREAETFLRSIGYGIKRGWQKTAGALVGLFEPSINFEVLIKQ